MNIYIKCVFGCIRSLLALFLVATITSKISIAQTMPEKIRVGALVSQTGPAAPAAFAFLTGVKIAIVDINRSGGILGKQIELVLADDQTDPTIAVGETRRLLSREKVNVIIGPILSALHAAVAPLITQAKVVQIGAPGALIVGTKREPYSFSMNFDPESTGKVMVDHTITNLRAKSIAWLGDTGPQAKQVSEVVKNELAAKNLKLAGYQEMTVGTIDVTPQLLSLRRTQPEVLFLWTVTGQDTGNVVKTLRDIGWNVPVLAASIGSLVPGPILKVAGPEAFDNMVSVAVKAFTACPADNVGNQALARLKDKIKLAEPDQYAQIAPLVVAWGSDAMLILKAAIEATRTVDAEIVSHWIERNSHTVKNLVGGQMSTSPESHFLLGTSSMAFVEHPDRLRPDGLMNRVGC